MKKYIVEILVWTSIISGIILIMHFLNINNKEKNSECLTIGYDDTFIPMGFRDSRGQAVGFDIDLAREVGKSIGKEVVFQPIDWTMKETELRNGNIDLIWNGYSINEQRLKNVDFSRAYLEDKQVIIVKGNSEINNKKDFKGKILGVQGASSAMDAVNKDKEFEVSLKDSKPILYESNNDALMDLDAGRIDGVVADEVLARYYINKRGKDKYKVLEENFGEELYGVGIRKGDKNLKMEIDKGLEEVISTGKAKKISEKWFGEDLIYKEGK